MGQPRVKKFDTRIATIHIKVHAKFQIRSSTEKRQREETDNVWASASAPTEEREEQAHTYNTRNQAQKRNK